MPISAVCNECQKKYSVKEEMAGKRFRCKECQAVIEVPAPETEDDDDPFAGLDLKSAGKPVRRSRRDDDDDDEEDDYDDDRPRRRTKSASTKSRTKKRSRGGSMPISAILTIICQCLLGAFCLVNSIIILVRDDPSVPHKMGALMGVGLRLAINATILVGMLKRSNTARQWSRGLSILGASFGMLAVVVIIALNPSSPEAIGTAAVMAVQSVIWVTIIICTSTESAADWFNE